MKNTNTNKNQQPTFTVDLFHWDKQYDIIDLVASKINTNQLEY